MKNILVPTDFSENAYNALKYAVQFFQGDQCKFFLLNTYTPVLYNADFLVYSPGPMGLEEIYKNNSKKGLERVESKIKRDFPNSLHSFENISSFNMLIEEMKIQIKKNNIELVVMGTQGATGAKEILFGTHTVHAIKRVKCPLLAIPSNFVFQPPKKILFPTDYGIEYSKDQLELLAELTKKHQSKIQILNIYQGFPFNDEQVNAKKMLADKLDKISHQFHSIERDNIAEAIYEFQKEYSTDFLVMINNKHSFFQNVFFRPVINNIGFHVKVPFMVLPHN